MVRGKLFGVAILLIFSVLACNDVTEPDADGEWLIPVEQVRDGGPGKDGIPALTEPPFVTPGQADYIGADDLVLGVVINGEARAYPHPILDWHEIINDDIGGTKISITYCPLTGTGIGYDPHINGQVTTFGVSGLLYNSNLIPYDRATNSNWSQMFMKSVNGDLIGTTIEIIPLIETRWDTWQAMFPSTKVVSTQTGYTRSYGIYPYSDYRNSDFLLFPVANDDGRLPRKERVHGIIAGGGTRVYRIESFGDSVTVYNDSFSALSLVIAGSRALNFATAYDRRLPDGTTLTFTPIQNSLPVIMIDNEGTVWNVLGNAVSGPRTGSRLNPVSSYTAYWFAWGAFFPGAEIFEAG